MWDELEEIEKRLQEPKMHNLVFGGMFNGNEGQQILDDFSWLMSRCKVLQTQRDELRPENEKLREALEKILYCYPRTIE